MTPTTKNSAGRVLGGRYTLLAPIAQGGMGEVWKARDRVSGRLVAAKVLRQELSGEALSLSRLRLEARNAMSIQHPNIANVMDSGEEDGRGWIVMELVDGLPLTHYLKGGARIGTQDLLPVLMQVAMALGAASNAGVVHRDIKPANILVRADGMAKLTDFGISRATDQVDLTAAGMVMGTAQYLPPEQAMGEKATSLGDLYALGVIAYEAAAGRRPFTGDTQVDIAFSHVNDPVPPLPADVPGPFADIILHLLEKDPKKRPESGLALVREISQAARLMGLPVDPHPLPEPAGSGEDAPAPRPGSRPVAPVHHVPRRTLPDSLLTAPEGLSDAPAPMDEAASATPETGEFPTDPRRARRDALARRLKERADARREADERTGAPAPPRDAEESGAVSAAPSTRPRAAIRADLPRGGRSTTPFAPVREPRNDSRSARWHAVSARSPRPGEAAPPEPTAYNRSVVAPPPSLGGRFLRWALVAFTILALAAIGVYALHHMLGSLTSILGEGRPVLEEVTAWQSPWAAV